MPKLERDSLHLRDGTVDLQTGVVGTLFGPEIRTQPLFRDRLEDNSDLRFSSSRVN